MHPGKAGAATIGLFDGEGDVGAVGRAGATVYDPVKQTYEVTGGGANMWFTNDALHFVWKEISGDVALSAAIRFEGEGGDPHRKACLMFRQSLDSDAVYVDAAQHGSGLTSLQFREAKGGLTREVQSNISGPTRLRLEKHGKEISLWVAGPGEVIHPSGASIRLVVKEPFYVGIGVCAHNNSITEKAVFSEVQLKQRTAIPSKTALLSTLETVAISSKDRKVAYWTTNHIEAPNWSRDGAWLVFNGRGRIYRMPAKGGVPELIETGTQIRCNNDHGFSADGSQFAISDGSQPGGSRIYLLPSGGGLPRKITNLAPSYWHGWSPDGKTLAFCGERDGEFDVYTIPVEGGPETRLTTAKGLDDGPEYTADGRWIYFNSERSGLMQVWRMRPDGSGQEQVTSDEFNNWFPHPSPDGKWLVFLSYGAEVKGHPENQEVKLRIMPLKGGKSDVVASLFGGQGTMNVPSWSPDSRQIAFVSYQLIPMF